MKSTKVLLPCLAGSLSVAISSMAGAASFSPVKSSLVGDGTITVTVGTIKNVTCHVAGNGSISADGSFAKLATVKVSGGQLCDAAEVIGLPWKIYPLTATTGYAVGVGFKVMSVGCGPLAVNIAFDSSGVITAPSQSTPLCSVLDLKLSTQPALKVSP